MLSLLKISIFCFVAVTGMLMSSGANAAADDLTLIRLQFTDAFGNDKTDFNVGEQFLIQSTVVNNGVVDKDFTYIVRVLDNSGQARFEEGLSASIVPAQVFTVAQSFTPMESGTYNVEVLLLDGDIISGQATTVLKTTFIVN